MGDELEITSTRHEHIIIGDTVYYKHLTHWYPDENVLFLAQDEAIVPSGLAAEGLSSPRLDS